LGTSAQVLPTIDPKMADNTQPNLKKDENALKTPSSDGNGAVTSDNKKSRLKHGCNSNNNKLRDNSYYLHMEIYLL